MALAMDPKSGSASGAQLKRGGTPVEVAVQEVYKATDSSWRQVDQAPLWKPFSERI